MPSEVVGALVALTNGAPRVLVVNGFDRNDRATNLRQNVTAQSWAPPGNNGSIERVYPQQRFRDSCPNFAKGQFQSTPLERERRGLIVSAAITPCSSFFRALRAQILQANQVVHSEREGKPITSHNLRGPQPRQFKVGMIEELHLGVPRPNRRNLNIA